LVLHAGFDAIGDDLSRDQRIFHAFRTPPMVLDALIRSRTRLTRP
jgi:hypothetical protein